MKPTKEKVRELLDEGMKPKDIAEKLGIKPATVYTYRHIFKKEEEPIEVMKVEKAESVSEKKYESLKRENESLAKQVKKLADENVDLDEKIIELQKELKELTEKYKQFSQSVSNGLSTNNAEIESFQKMLIESRNECEQEKAKHETLLKYVLLIAKGELNESVKTN